LVFTSHPSKLTINNKVRRVNVLDKTSLVAMTNSQHLGGATMRYNANMKNETKNSAHMKNMLEHPESARLNASLRFSTTNPGYAGYIESVEAKIDSGRGYKGKHEEAGRKAGTRVMSRMVWDREQGCEVEEFYVA
jgi:hypothetical protein